MITASKLTNLIDTFDGLSTMRYRHDLQKHFIFTVGVLSIVKEASATWLLNLLAYDVFIAAKKAAKTGGFFLMRFSLNVDAEQKNATSQLTFAGCDDALMKFPIGPTGFPPGEWSIYIYPCMEEETFYCEAILPSEY